LNGSHLLPNCICKPILPTYLKQYLIFMFNNFIFNKSDFDTFYKNISNTYFLMANKNMKIALSKKLFSLIRRVLLWNLSYIRVDRALKKCYKQKKVCKVFFFWTKIILEKRLILWAFYCVMWYTKQSCLIFFNARFCFRFMISASLLVLLKTTPNKYITIRKLILMAFEWVKHDGFRCTEAYPIILL